MRTETQTLEAQERFLEAYATHGTIQAARREAGVGRTIVWLWERDDYLGFRERYRVAREEHRDHLEDILFNRLEDPKCPPLLVVFALNGAYPEKYKSVTVIDDTGKDLLAELRGMASKPVSNSKSSNGGKGKPEGGDIPTTPSIPSKSLADLLG
jgi:hypothetical protein